MSSFRKIALVVAGTLAWWYYEGHREEGIRANVETQAVQRESVAASKAKLDTQAEYAVEYKRVLTELRSFVEATVKDEKTRDSRQSALITKRFNALEAALKERPQCP